MLCVRLKLGSHEGGSLAEAAAARKAHIAMMTRGRELMHAERGEFWHATTPTGH